MQQKLKHVLAAAGLAMLAGGAFGAPGAQAETTLSLVYPFPDFLVYTKSCKEFAEKVNAAGVVKIDVKPFNSIGMFEQAGEIRKGTVDMTCLPAAFYARGLPENEAISTSNSSPAEVRANGGMAIIDELHQKYMNMKYLGWVDTGVKFHVYFKDAPKFGDDGLPDLSDVKMRDNPIYGAFFRALNAETHQMPVTDVYSAIQKGVVNASAWTSIGVKGLKWDEFLRHRLDPDFYQTDIGIIMNLDTWNSLSETEQKALQAAVIEHEESSRKARMAEVVQEKADLEAAGMQVHVVPNADKYLEIALDSAYDRMTERLKSDDRPLDAVEKLRGLYIK
ncbi:C4-dicarboxylate ABC transporter substrate-binding protein [Hwanghaeella grinnelliae]|uniref:C4-dicarboxylate ABC transporter substrate-binding protein n=1 Tax=Hwanghaeella grinnelliae TaxID=2500179 RepID=A0A437QHJ3_9PROT|nr:TRAP transporter substrate-binding protein DctP [Hwanghaeella grinnelliae]RVU34021.1 C4-dicarboxylate ABC transporter substrate-binding protein [Hwanghaeella grinnelliae]